MQKILPLTYQSPSSHNQYSSVPLYPYSSQPINNPYYYLPGSLGEGYPLNSSQSWDFQDQKLRQSYPQNYNPTRDGYMIKKNMKIEKFGYSDPDFNKISDQERIDISMKKERHETSNQTESNFEKYKGETSLEDHKKNSKDNDVSANAWLTKTRKSSNWVKIEELLKEKKISEAYAVCVAQNDEENLLRLMKETGIAVHLLSELMIEEILRIVERKLFDHRDRLLILNWIEYALKIKSLTNINQLEKINQVLTQILEEKNLKKEEHLKIEKIKKELETILKGENGDISKGINQYDKKDFTKN